MPKLNDTRKQNVPIGIGSGGWLERIAVLKAISDEPECPGDCPPNLMAILNQSCQTNDTRMLLWTMREIVRLTKMGITERVNLLRSNEKS